MWNCGTAWCAEPSLPTAKTSKHIHRHKHTHVHAHIKASFSKAQKSILQHVTDWSLTVRRYKAKFRVDALVMNYLWFKVQSIQRNRRSCDKPFELEAIRSSKYKSIHGLLTLVDDLVSQHRPFTKRKGRRRETTDDSYQQISGIVCHDQ